MKYNILLTSVIGLFASSCSNDVVERRIDTGTIEFEVSMGSNATRAGVDVQNTKFADQEEIDVFISSSTVTYTQPIVYKATESEDNDGYYALSDPRNNSGTALSPAQIPWPESPNTIDIYAYHPKAVVTSLSSANSFTVKADQSTDGNYRLSDLMEAEKTGVVRQDNRVQLKFSHLLSKVIITLRGDRSLNISHAGWRTGATTEQTTAAQIESNSLLIGAKVELLNIQPTITITKPKTLSSASGSATAITVGTITAATELVDPTDATSAWQIACIVPPQQLSSAKLVKVTMPTVNNVAGGVLYFTSAANFESRKVNTYNVTVHAKELTVSGTIKSWDAGDTDQGHESQPVITF